MFALDNERYRDELEQQVESKNERNVNEKMKKESIVESSSISSGKVFYCCTIGQV